MRLPKLIYITEGLAPARPELAIQVRAKQLETRPLMELAVTLRRAPWLSINDRTDVAIAVGADGVHLPANGVSPQLPKRLAPDLIVGVSVHSLEAAQRAEHEGADYVQFGAIFGSGDKPPQGLKALEQVARSISIPLIAVGGITYELIEACMNAGAYGVAAIRGFQCST
jgi:thiamine-phosphate pyrophosphorylase